MFDTGMGLMLYHVGMQIVLSFMCANLFWTELKSAMSVHAVLSIDSIKIQFLVTLTPIYIHYFDLFFRLL